MKVDFIDGTVVPPPSNTNEFKKWNRIDSMVTTWILNCMTKELAESFMYVGSSRELWIELEARYGESNSPLIYQLQREIGQVTQGNLSITEYYTKLKRLWDELMCLAPMPKCFCTGCTCGVNKAMDEMNASNHLIQFLVGLNSVYDQARSQILLLEPLPTVTKAYSMLIRIEKQMQMNLDSIETNNGAAFQIKGQNYKKKSIADKRHVICEHCQRTGHTKDSCFKLHGVPDWYKDMTDQRKKIGGKGRGYTAMVTGDLSQNSAEEKYSNITELIRHEMKKLMLEDRPSDPLQINFAQLDNFADVHQFCSYTKLTNPLIIYLPNGHTQKDLETNKVLATAYLIKNLYVLKSSPVTLNSNCSSHSCTTDMNQYTLWHQRLGHFSSCSMKHIAELPQLDCTLTPCDVCPQAKMHKLPFESSEIRTNSAFALIHLDIWGPYREATTSGCHYFLTVVDDFTRTTWTFFMKFKSQTLELFQKFCKLVSTQFNKIVQTVRTDNGSEFLSSSFQHFLQISGIIHQRSCAYTPQQNGVVERKHRSLLEIARSIMFQASFPRRFWGDAILGATYLINRYPTAVLG
ncbi:UNVERIFIED_CONTAM: Copia protein [Sesamum indicum]